MSDKRKIFDLLMSCFSRLDKANKEYSRCISDFQELVGDFIKYDFVEYQRPPYYADCLSEKDIPPVDPVTSNLPPELASLILLLQAELKNQRQALAANKHLMSIFSNQLHIALDNCQNCDFCHDLFANNLIRTVDDKGTVKSVCERCFENEYFDCHKCKRTLPVSEQGEEDNQLGYGWICKDCIKPMGFPPIVVIAPDFPGCEEVAGATLDALCKYAYQSTGIMEPEDSDTITLRFVKKLSEYDALYESPIGAQYEVNELDYRGIGSTRKLEGYKHV